MRTFSVTVVLAAVWTIGTIALPASVNAAKITIYRGLEKQTVDTTKRPTGGVHFARPAASTAAVPPTTAARAPKAARSTTVLGAGNTLWLRGKYGQLVACRVWSAGIVGKEIIRCTGRDAFGR